MMNREERLIGRKPQYIDKVSANYSHRGTCSLPPVFVNQILLQRSYMDIHVIIVEIFILWLLKENVC